MDAARLDHQAVPDLVQPALRLAVRRDEYECVHEGGDAEEGAHRLVHLEALGKLGFWLGFGLPGVADIPGVGLGVNEELCGGQQK